MQNKFDAAGYPTAEPRTAVAGDRWVWRRPDIAAVYDPALYSLEYRFTSQANTATTEIATATESGVDYVVEIEATDTAAFAAGAWAWEAVIVRTADGAEAVADSGLLDVTAAGTASHVYTVLQAIRATIEGTATEDQSRIEIAGRVLERRSIKELTDLEALYSRKWRAERAAADRAAGRAGSRVLVKMGA